MTTKVKKKIKSKTSYRKLTPWRYVLLILHSRGIHWFPFFIDILKFLTFSRHLKEAGTRGLL